MTDINSTLKFIINLAKAQTIVNRRFDAQLSGYGLGFNDFVILYHLSQAPHEKMRRVDLADKIGFTASGITRMLAPMEKIGLVSRESNERDARVSYVVLAPGGKRLLEESVKTAEHVALDIFPKSKIKKIEKLPEILDGIGGLL
ncbi:MarR family transcriptional regulator [Mucilaginibacter sp. HC2]|uniref:MarR family winged helix-turn-helix transcriptional regulator n=1 Tax=Mucilaginibacter inviolabilis TaxID=2714892 RepID=UPI00140E20D1|nr:MarR family transcriptional regulator [Mucilaginibacter inviolabilis]NHA04470.1 MarR family transcriptional regulator [Mucilaginibacter inviolabilis]